MTASPTPAVDPQRQPFSFLQRMRGGTRTARTPGLVTQPPLAERHATWLELFFDLVFVFTIAELTHVAEENLTFAGVGEVALLLFAVFWVWIGFAYYADQFDANDLPYRFVLVSGMFGVILFSLTLHDAFHGGSAAFALAYVIVRLLVIGLYTRAWLLVENTRPLVGRLLASYVLSVILFAISIFLPPPVCYGLWILALIVEYVGSPIAYITIRDVPAQVSHMPERFGLFIIIVLGEGIITVAGGTQDLMWQAREILLAVCGFVVVVCMWWLYFNRADSEVISRAVSSGRNRDLLLSYVYGYSHVVIALGAILGTATFISVIEAAQHAEPIAESVYLLSTVGLATYLVGTVLNHWAAPHSLALRQIVIRLAGAALLVVLSLVRVITDPVIAVATAALILLVLSAAERPLEREEHEHADAVELD